MHILVFETDSHRQRKYTDEGCAFLEAHGEVEIIRQIDHRTRKRFTAIPRACSRCGWHCDRSLAPSCNHPSRLAICRADEGPVGDI